MSTLAHLHLHSYYWGLQLPMYSVYSAYSVYCMLYAVFVCHLNNRLPTNGIGRDRTSVFYNISLPLESVTWYIL
jgi:hypothetical protein